MAPISPSRFYSYSRRAAPPTSSTLRRPEEDGWLLFQTQDAALDAIEKRPGTALWALETDRQGSRRFVVATYALFWKRYKRLRAHFRKYYEVIRASEPCHLYLDVEFKREANPWHSGRRTMEVLKREIAQQMLERCGILQQAYFLL